MFLRALEGESEEDFEQNVVVQVSEDVTNVSDEEGVVLFEGGISLIGGDVMFFVGWSVLAKVEIGNKQDGKETIGEGKKTIVGISSVKIFKDVTVFLFEQDSVGNGDLILTNFNIDCPM